MRSSSTHNPVFYHWYATRTCGPSNRTVRSSWDNVCLTYTGGPRTVRNKDDCQRHGGRELAWNGRVKSGEPLINVVRTNKPKALRGLSQNGMWRGVRVSLFSYRRRNATGEQAGPNPFSDTDTTSCRRPGSQVGLLPPSPLRTAREGFPSSSSSISKGSLQNPVGRFPSTFTILICCQRAFQREAAPANFMAVICFASSVGLSDSRVTRHQREVSPLARGAYTPIRSITERRSLPPSSHTPTPISSPYGTLSLAGDVWAYHVPCPYPRMG